MRVREARPIPATRCRAGVRLVWSDEQEDAWRRKMLGEGWMGVALHPEGLAWIGPLKPRGKGKQPSGQGLGWGRGGQP